MGRNWGINLDFIFSALFIYLLVQTRLWDKGPKISPVDLLLVSNDIFHRRTEETFFQLAPDGSLHVCHAECIHYHYISLHPYTFVIQMVGARTVLSLYSTSNGIPPLVLLCQKILPSTTLAKYEVVLPP